jgi:hypothetical protein
MQNVDKLILNKEHISPTMRESLQETFEILVWIFKEYSEKLKNTPTMVDVNPTSPETRGKKS